MFAKGEPSEANMVKPNAFIKSLQLTPSEKYFVETSQPFHFFLISSKNGLQVFRHEPAKQVRIGNTKV